MNPKGLASRHNDQLPLFQKRGLLFKEKISVYFFVNEEVAQSLEVTKESMWATAFRGLKPD